MSLYIVTIRIKKNPDHDPRNKQTGQCPVSPRCTDTTGEHHSFLFREKDLDSAMASVTKRYGDRIDHITRIEEAYFL